MSVPSGEPTTSEWEPSYVDEQTAACTENGCVKRLDFESAAIINQMDGLSLAENANRCNNGIGDGNDSGVDTGVTTETIQLQRALSNNSAGYASSSGGMDAQFASCNSSLLSVCSDSNDGKLTVVSLKASIDCTSENGSESSSLSGDKQRQRQSSSSKKRVGVTEPSLQVKSVRKSENNVAKCRTRAASLNRAAVHRTSGAPNLATTERARSRDKQVTSNSCGSVTLKRSSSMRRPVKPDSLPTNFRESTPPHKNSPLARAASVTRRTPSCTPSTEDGRWPSIANRSGTKNYHRNSVNANESLVIKTKAGPIVLQQENKTSAEKHTTLPRRKKVKSEEDLTERRLSRSESTNRERMTSVARRTSMRESPNKLQSHPPRSQKTPARTLIYHETSCQTALTSHDIDDAFAGNAKQIQIDAVQTVHRESQVDIRDKDIERLEEKIRAIGTENAALQQNLIERSQLLATMEQQLVREREEKEAMKKELQSNTERVLGMLELVHATPAPENDTSCDSLLMLESQIQLSGHVLEEKQCEINTLRQFCKELQAEMNRTIQVQQNLLEERKCFEKETSELQDFLQDEKTAIVEALKEAENEIEQYQTKLKEKEEDNGRLQHDVERLSDECRHLVRISEQRRQEFLGMQSKYAALESKSKNMVAQQNVAVSGATLALSDLGSRLNDLVEQLISSYNISENDLEDVIFHNEAYANSEEPSPEYERVRDKLVESAHDGSLSPQRHQSFIAAVINAIKSAATAAKDKVHRKSIDTNGFAMGNSDESDTTEMLDSETEPCLMMENVLEDVSMPDSHTHNMISSTTSFATVPSMQPLDDQQEDSLHNLCEAIANRQKIEEQTNLMMMHQNAPTHDDHSLSNDGSGHDSSIANIPSISEQQFPVQILVDHVINVDNLVTKLLKVLRIIQIENDQCIQQLIAEKNSLQVNKEEMAEKLKTWEESNLKLKNDLEEASKQLINSCNDLTYNKTELIKSRREINKLNEDICNLSTLCSKTEQTLPAEQNRKHRKVSKEDILDAIRQLNDENGELAEHEIISLIHSFCQDVSNNENALNGLKTSLNDSLQNGHSNSSSNGHKVDVDTKSQNDTIIKAIETLNGIQSIVQQCPVLVNLQRDLELMLPPPDCNANTPNCDNDAVSSTQTPLNIDQSINLTA